MKKIIIALAISGFTTVAAQAQNNKCIPPGTAHKRVAYTAHHRSHLLAKSNTYQVCREEGGYYVCCLHRGTSVTPLAGKPVAMK